MARMGNNGNRKSSYNTREVNYNEFLDLKKLAQYTIVNKKEDQKGQTVNWLKVKCFKYEKQFPSILQYKYNFHDDYKYINVSFVRVVLLTEQSKRIIIMKIWLFLNYILNSFQFRMQRKKI
ncbi:unnamed protein product [Diabrotica balteata]|uniref:Uncharacterized protein n=1 Tax=Diabrotica balteata TaxID=107213 RepID=A0A9N9T8N0_DIABA|nr:unnamed protein product [Diabrotica balteata]